jgi:probable phosphoglycerate mutase
VDAARVRGYTRGAVELILIRHALPLRALRSDGAPADPPLAEEGQAQARRLADWLADEPLGAVYASPLRRARQTAQPLAERRGLLLRLEAGVAEFDAHAPVYVPLEQLKVEQPEAWRALVSAGAYTGDAAAFRRTVVASLERLIAAHPGERVAVVCHGGVINAWLAHLLGLSRLFVFEPPYASISRFLAARSGERSLASLGEVAHLRDLGSSRL